MQEFKDIKYQTHPQVYQPAEDTYLLAENLQVEKRSMVLEIGTGTGIIAIIAAKEAQMVTATDVNPYALDCAVKNIVTNKTFNIELRKGNLFEPVEDEKFDLILFNTPYLPSDDNEKVYDELEKAWNGGVDGREVIDIFIKDVKDHLNPGGKVQLVQSSLSDSEKTLEILKKQGFDASITAREKCFFEEIMVITASL
ncbi:MAG: class I SAM-dependent methyltransferase [Methanobacterium sp.]|nr:class I SAM-dependent methyltransferase [Methanobacterium sp.]